MTTLYSTQELIDIQTGLIRDKVNSGYFIDVDKCHNYSVNDYVTSETVLTKEYDECDGKVKCVVKSHNDSNYCEIDYEFYLNEILLHRESRYFARSVDNLYVEWGV